MNGDEYAEQVALMSKTMYAYCLSRTNSYHDAEDLAQEILLISCKNGNSFPSEKAFYSFVWRTADNILKSWYRNKSKQNCAELEDSISDASWERLEEQAQQNEQLTLITKELALLNSNHRRAMVAYYIDGFSLRKFQRGSLFHRVWLNTFYSNQGNESRRALQWREILGNTAIILCVLHGRGFVNLSGIITDYCL